MIFMYMYLFELIYKIFIAIHYKKKHNHRLRTKKSKHSKANQFDTHTQSTLRSPTTKQPILG